MTKISEQKELDKAFIMKEICGAYTHSSGVFQTVLKSLNKLNANELSCMKALIISSKNLRKENNHVSRSIG